MSHGKVHQHDAKYQRNKQPAQRNAACGTLNLFFRNVAYNACPVAAFIDRVANGARACDFFVILHRHAVCQQTDGNALYAFYLGYGFFDMRRTRRTSHTRHVEFLFHHTPPPLRIRVYYTPYFGQKQQILYFLFGFFKKFCSKKVEKSTTDPSNNTFSTI